MRQENRRQASTPVRQPRSHTGDQSFAFRRSRTITGSAAASVQAAGENRGQLRSPRLHEHSLRKHRRKLSTYLIATVALAGGLVYVLTSYVASVEVSTSSAQPLSRPLSSSTYENLVEEYMKDRPFERFLFALSDSGIDTFIRAKAPEVASARLDSGDGLWTGSLTITLREPVVAWTIQNKEYFVDATGSAYTTNYFSVPSVVVTDKSGVSSTAGVVTSGKLLRFIGRVITLVNQSGISTVEAVELPSNSTRQVDFKLRDRDYSIKAHLDRDPAGQATDIINAVRYIDGKGIKPQYIDVRVSSKAYYRDKQ